MKKVFICIIGIALSISSLAADGLTGMCLVVDQNNKEEWNGFGQIRRIDIENGQVIQDTAIISEGNKCICPRFSPNGNKIAYIAKEGSELVICDINGNGKIRVETQAAVSSGQNISWTDNSIWVFRGLFSNSNKIDRHNPVTGAYIETITLPQAMRQCYVAQDESIAAGTKKNNGVGFITNFPDGNLSYKQVSQGCSSGPNPNGTMMCNNLWEACGHHQTMKVYKIDTMINNEYPVKGYYGIDTGCSNAQKILDLNDEYIWNHQMWAGHCNVVVLPVGHGGGDQLDDKQLPWVYNVDSAKWQQCYSGNIKRDIVWHPYDFYQGKTPGPLPYMNLNPKRAEFSVNNDGTNASPPLDITVVNGGDGTMGDISVESSFVGINTSISKSGNEQILTLSVNTTIISAGFLDSKIHKGNIVISAPVSGIADSVVKGVIPIKLTVIGPSRLSEINITPATAYLTPNDSFDFKAEALDQYRDPMDTVDIRWNTLNSSSYGTIDTSTGMFYSGTKSGGSYTITAKSGTITDTAEAVITETWIKINSGTNTSIPGWENDNNYLTGGRDHTWSMPPNYGTGLHSAPAEVYNSVTRSTDTSHTYNIPGSMLPPAKYKLIIHGSADTGNRHMVYVANGDTVLHDFSWEDEIGATDSTGYIEIEEKIIIEDNNGLTLECLTGEGSEVFEAGIELIAIEELDFVLLSPTGGETFYVGDSMHVTWTGKEETLKNEINPMVFLCLSPFQRYQISWAENIPNTDLNKIPGIRKEWKWEIPQKIYDYESNDSVSIVGKEAYLRIENYEELDITTESDKFTIKKSSDIELQTYQQQQIKVHPNPTTGLLQIDEKYSGRVIVYNSLGNKIKKTNPDNGIINISDVPAGIYFIKIDNKYMAKVIKK